MFEEYNKPESQRVPLPNPPIQFLTDIQLIQKFYQKQVQEKEKELPRSLSPLERKETWNTKIEDFKMVEGGLAECPNCTRTFFPDRLKVHLKSCKPGKPLMPKKKRKRMNIHWQNFKKKEVKSSKFRMPLRGKGKKICDYWI